MGFLREFYGILIGVLCSSYAISCYFYGGSVGFLLDFLDISMIVLLDYYGMSIESKLKSIENKFKLN